MENKIETLRGLIQDGFKLFNESISIKEEVRTEEWYLEMASRSFLLQVVAEALLDAIKENKEVDYDNILLGLKKLISLEGEKDTLTPDNLISRWEEISTIPHLKA